MITYKLTLNIGYAGEEHEEEFTVEDMGGYNDKSWNELSENEQEEILNETWKDWSNNYIDGGWEKI